MNILTPSQNRKGKSGRLLRRPRQHNAAATVSEYCAADYMAQRHEIRRQQIYAWRHDLKKNGLWSPEGGALFYPMDVPVQVAVPAPQLPVPEVPPPTVVALRLRGGRSLHFESTIDPTALSALIRAVDGA